MVLMFFGRPVGRLLGGAALGAFLIASVLPSQSLAGERPSREELAKLKVAAETGDAKAQLAYAKALGTTEEAHAWTEKAANQGLAEAWYWLGYTSVGDTTKYYEKAAEGGYPEAFHSLFEKLLFRAGYEADVTKAKHYLDLAKTLKVAVDEETIFVVTQCFEAGELTIAEAARPGKNEDTRNTDLAEKYANGDGVPRDWKSAMALVCHGSDVPAELTSMVQSLYETRNQKTLAPAFRFCDHVTSGMNGGYCSATAEEDNVKVRDAAFDKLSKAWPAPQRAALWNLRAAAGTYFESYSVDETDMSGTARASIAIGARAEKDEELLADLTRFDSGNMPTGNFAKADVELNAAYQDIMKRKEDVLFGTVDKDGVRRTQRAWLPFRDAFAKFGTLRYPKTNADTWKAWATQKRTTELQSLLEN